MTSSDSALAESVKLPKGVKFIKKLEGISEYKLDNGLKVLLKPNSNSPLVAWQVWYKVGSRNEKAGITGIAHYLEHIMFKGTKLFEKGEIAQTIQLNGGVFNAFTGDDYTAYFEDFSPEKLELAIKIESDRMRNAKLDKDEIDLERSVIVSELEGGENNPHNVLYKTLKSTAYNVHSYKNPIIGWPEDLKNINNENMKEFYDKHYRPDNAVAVLVGKFNEETALKLIEKYFGDYKAGKKIDEVAKEPKQEDQRKSKVQKDGLVKLMGYAFHIPEFNHEDYPALNLIADILFGSTSSRGYKKLVDSGLLLNVSGYAEAGIDPGLLRVIANINLDVDNEQIEKLLDEEFEAIKEGASEEELTRAKARIEASSIYERDGAHSEAMQIGYFEAIGKWEDYVDWVDVTNKITNEDIKRVAKKYFTEANKTVAVLLPEKPEEDLTANDQPPVGSKPVANYGAGTVEPLSPKKLKKLLELSKPKYAKDLEAVDTKLGAATLANDLDQNVEIIFKEDHNLPLLYINGLIYAGSVNNPTDKPTLSKLTADLLERGTKKHNKFEVADLLDDLGAEINISNRRETAKFEIAALSKNLDKTLALFKEHIYEPAFDLEELEKLKKETISYVKQEDEYLSSVAYRELNRIIYPEGHPYYSYSPEEKIKAIESITMEDIKNFFKENYTVKNLKLSIVGDITEAELKSKFLPIIKDWNTKGNQSKKPDIPLVEAKKPVEKSIIYEDKQQTEIMMGHSGSVDRSHPDFYALLIANYALGGSSLSSKLGTVVRDENGLVYTVGSHFSSTIGAGAFTVNLGCNPKNVSKAIKLTKETIKEYLKEGISETELEATKSYLTGSFAGRNLSSNEETSKTLSSLMLYGLDTEYIDNYSKIINDITLEEVNAAARKYIKPDLLNTVIAGPKFE